MINKIKEYYDWGLKSKKGKKQASIKFIKEQNTLLEVSQVLKIMNDLNKEFTILVISDLHIPFEHKDYLQHCIDMYKKYNCNKVVFIGDILDNHYSSYHEVSQKADGPNKELDKTIKTVAKWYKAFPEAYIMIGNHDRIVTRKLQSAGIAEQWLKSYSEVLNTQGWIWMNDVILNNIYFCHGEGGSAKTTSKNLGMSIVQGHRHSETYLEYINQGIFALQIGVGVDKEKYAFEYGRVFTKPWILNCSVIDGDLPMLLPMKLNKNGRK